MNSPHWHQEILEYRMELFKSNQTELLTLQELKLINASVDELNKEAKDVLSYQVS